MRKYLFTLIGFCVQLGFMIYYMVNSPYFSPWSLRILIFILELLIIGWIYVRIAKEQKIEQELLEFQRDIAQKARAERGEE